MNKHAQALGRLNRGKTKNVSLEERKKRSNRMIQMNKDRQRDNQNSKTKAD